MLTHVCMVYVYTYIIYTYVMYVHHIYANMIIVHLFLLTLVSSRFLLLASRRGLALTTPRAGILRPLPATRPRHVISGDFIQAATNEDLPGNGQHHSVFPMRAVKSETSRLSPCGCSPNFHLVTKPTHCFPYATYIRSTDGSQKFSMCSYSDNARQSSQ